MGVNKRAFTLIEIMVVIVITGLVLPAIFYIVFAILQQQTKIYRLAEIKRQGDYVLNVVENTIRNNAVSIHSGVPNDTNIICDTLAPIPTPASYFKDKSGNWFRFYFNPGSPDKISSQSAFMVVDLTTSKVKISDYNIICSRLAGYSTPIVSVSFRIGYNTTSTRPEETTSMNYQTKIKLKTY